MKTRIPALFAAIALLLSFLCACSGYRTGDTTLVARAGDTKITAETYRFICNKNAVQYFKDEGSDEFVARKLTPEEYALLNDAVEWEIKRYAAVESMAEKQDVRLSRADREAAAAQVFSAKEAYAREEDFYEELDDLFMSENVLYEQALNMQLEDKLYGVMSEKIDRALTNDALRADIEKYCYATVQILFTGANAVETLERVRAGIKTEEDFYRAVAAYSLDADKGVAVCIEGERIEEFENAARALQVGEISGVVKSSVGAHIILRVALTNELIEEKIDSLRSKDVARIYRAQMDEEARTIEIRYTGKVDGLLLDL